MALIFIDGFDAYDQNDNDISTKLAEHWASVTSYGNGFQVRNGRYTGKGVRFHSSGNQAELRTLDFWSSTSGDLSVLGFNFLTDASGSPVSLNLFSSSGVAGQPVIHIGSGSLDFTGNGHSQVVPFSGQQWHNMEVLMTTEGGANKFSLQVYLDDILQIELAPSVSNLTKDSNYCSLTTVASGASAVTIDDFYILNSSGVKNNSRIGPDARIETLFPSNAKNNIEIWNKTGVTTVEDAVDNVPYDITKYISTPNSGEAQEFEFPNLVNIIAPIASQIRSVSKGESGVVYHHVVNGVSVETFNLTSDYLERSTIFDQGDLTVANINSLTGGISS
jgi:hypothetical protein